jgi:small-conductance mechanosensitive channel
VFRIGVVYETDAATLQRIPALVQGLIERASPVRFDRSHLAALGNSACEFEFVYYVLSPDYDVYMDVQQEINLAIVRAFEAEGIGIAYPTQRLVVQQPERES